MGYYKQFCALVAATCFGIYIGINHVAFLVSPTAVNGVPAWVPVAQSTARWAIAGLGIAVFAWIVLDYTQEEDHD